ncbi:MAG TPA: carboxypeptidase-like regulatory domain-containing protein [Candidatus Saccharimonadia bacterium]|nr:carboxypeptidase-like regulatory domain-containing protein [Candidatus Saccharimonadia bacterium]
MDTRGEGGFTLIETILGLVVMTIMVTAITQLFVDNLRVVTLGKARAIGLSLANEQMEYLRDLPYQSVATQLGAIYPPGLIADNQVVSRGGYTFNLKTEITYVDDPYDGYASCPCASGPAAGKPQDLNPADYKKAQISVYLKSSGQLVDQLTTDLAGKAAETASNTGVLSVKVIDANGQPVANASVHILNTAPNPDVDITTTTDNQGLVVIPNLPPDSKNEYQVTASLSGYSTDATEADPAGTTTAVELNPNVLVQQITSLTLSIDRVSTMFVHVTDTSGAALASKAIEIRGAKVLEKSGGNPSVPSKYKYDVTSTTDASGNINLNTMEWDGYSFIPPSGWYLVSAQPYQPVALAPNTSQTVNLVLSNSSSYVAIATMTPTSGQTGTASASFTLTGSNFNGSTTVKLRQSGQPDITASGLNVTGSTKLTGNFNLTGAATGAWDVVVTSSGNTVTQTGGFSVTP